MLVGTEETPAFLHSTNAAKIMMSLKKGRPKAKVRLLDFAERRGLGLVLGRREPYPPVLLNVFYCRRWGKMPNKNKQTFSASAAVL